MCLLADAARPTNKCFHKITHTQRSDRVQNVSQVTTHFTDLRAVIYPHYGPKTLQSRSSESGEVVQPLFSFVFCHNLVDTNRKLSHSFQVYLFPQKLLYQLSWQCSVSCYLFIVLLLFLNIKQSCYLATVEFLSVNSSS